MEQSALSNSVWIQACYVEKIVHHIYAIRVNFQTTILMVKQLILYIFALQYGENNIWMKQTKLMLCSYLAFHGCFTKGCLANTFLFLVSISKLSTDTFSVNLISFYSEFHSQLSPHLHEERKHTIFSGRQSIYLNIVGSL